MKSIKKLNIRKLSKQELNPLVGGTSSDAVTNSHGQVTKTAGSFDADNKASDTDTSTGVGLYPINDRP